MITGEQERPRTSPWRFWGIAALIVLALGLVHAASTVLLLAFAGLLFGTCLRGLAGLVSRHTPLSLRWSMVVCVTGLGAASTALLIFGLPVVASQANDLVTQLETAVTRVHQQLQGSELGRQVLDRSEGIAPPSNSIARAAGVLATTAGALGAALFVMFVSLYVAFSPDVYRRGFTKLVRPARREQADRILDEIGSTLRRWMVGRMISMLAVGITTTLGLWALDVPLPITLGILAGALGFVPNVGPIVSAVPALLLAATIDPTHVLYVCVLYLVINIADGYILTPLIDQRAVDNPPALVITAQLLFGVLWGVLGVMLATPLVVCAVILVRSLYVERIEETHAPPDGGGPTTPLPRVQLHGG